VPGDHLQRLGERVPGPRLPLSAASIPSSVRRMSRGAQPTASARPAAPASSRGQSPFCSPASPRGGRASFAFQNPAPPHLLVVHAHANVPAGSGVRYPRGRGASFADTTPIDGRLPVEKPVYSSGAVWPCWRIALLRMTASFFRPMRACAASTRPDVEPGTWAGIRPELAAYSDWAGVFRLEVIQIT